MGQKTNALMVCSVVVISMSARHADAQVVVMHSFAGGGLDGKNPNGTLVQLGAQLFGLSEAGGSAADGGALFSIGMAGGGYDQLHAFGLGNDGSLPSGSLTLSAANFYGTTEGGGSAGQGTVFRIGGDGTGYGSVHQFVGAPGDGSLPQGSLVISGPNFFGTTGGGGNAGGGGTVFRTNADGSGYTIVHSFAGGTTDGQNPIYGAPAVSGTAVYGMTSLGGVSNTGVIYKIATDGSGYAILHFFTLSPTDGNTPFGSVIANGSVLYGMTTGGGAAFAGTVFRMNTDGSDFTILHSFVGGPTDGNDPLGELLLSGNELYGMTYRGGSANDGTIFSIGIDGSNYDLLHSFTGGPNDGANPASDLIQIGSTFYGTTVFGGASNDGTVFSFTPVPEPSSLLLLSATGSFAILFRRRWIGRVVRQLR